MNLPNSPRSKRVGDTTPPNHPPVTPRWGILVRQEILDHKLISVPGGQDDDDRCYSHASYDLRLGSDYMMPHESDDSGQRVFRNCEENGLITIPPFASVIISTYESVVLPNNVAGRFDLRIDHALEGLLAQMGTQVEPGYNGRLFALVHNISAEAKSIKYRDYETRPFTIEFHYTSMPSNPKPNQNKTLKEFITPNCARGGLNLVLKNLETVQNEVKKISQEFSTKKIAFFTGVVMLFLITGISTVIPFVLNKFTYDKNYFPLVNADMIATLKYGNRLDEMANIENIIHELEKRRIIPPSNRDDSIKTPDGLCAISTSPERLYADRLTLLKQQRNVLKNYPTRVKELKSIEDEIAHILDLLNK